jgi:LysM repeat protein
VRQVKHSFVKQMFDQRLTSNDCSWHATNSRSSNVCSIASREEQIMAIAVVIPGQFREPSSVSQIYARRRLMVLLTLAAIVLVLLVGTGHVVANRGGAPASASAIRPATSAMVATPAAANVYVAQAGDTLWSIGERFHGHTSLADYVDALISANGGTEIQVSQALTLP